MMTRNPPPLAPAPAAVVAQKPVVAPASDQKRHKIIVGVDYGTTFSGVSYVTTDKSSIDDINIITKWPGDPNTSWKTPTRIAYKQENPTLQSNKWGFEANSKLISNSWTKLLLDKNAVVVQYDDPTLFSDMNNKGVFRLPYFRDAPGVCEDFLRGVFEHVSARLRREMTDLTFENTPMECWITLPAIWSDEAKDATLQAAKRAGFGNRPADEVFTIAEPEAAAIATLNNYSGPGSEVLNPVKLGENILILDCGGGTVDITTYTIIQVEPLLEFEELCVGIGGKCGSTAIDRKLHELLSKRFGKAFDDIPWALKGPGSKFMTVFETIKRDFGHSNDYVEQELGPITLGIPDSKFYDEEERFVKLSHDDMKSLFDPVIEDITKLVEEQVDESKKNGGVDIDRIILVGGFGESPYLFKALQLWCQGKGVKTLMCPSHPQSAVVRGAALRGLEGIAPRMKRARRHYGIGISLPFREGTDPEKLAYFDELYNAKFCQGRLQWLIAKGEKIFSDTSRTFDVETKYTPDQPSTARINLYSCGLNDPPEYQYDSRAEKNGCITTDFGRDYDFGPNIKSAYNAKLGRMIYKFPHQVRVIFGAKGENLQFKDVVEGRVEGEAVIEFNRH